MFPSNLQDVEEHIVAASKSLKDISAKLEILDVCIDNALGDLALCVDEIMDKIAICEEKLEGLEESTKLTKLEVDHILYYQLYRKDIKVSGIPTDLNSSDLYKLMLRIGERYGILMTTSDIATCEWMLNKKYVLVKFNERLIKNAIMTEYLKKKDLRLHEVCDGVADSQAKVFLNNNVTTDESKLRDICHKLAEMEQIRGYKMISVEIPKAVIKLNNSEERTVTLEQLLNFF